MTDPSRKSTWTVIPTWPTDTITCDDCVAPIRMGDTAYKREGPIQNVSWVCLRCFEAYYWKDAYLARPVFCPFCGSDQLNASDYDSNGRDLSCRVTCNSCMRNWADHYVLQSVSRDDSASTGGWHTFVSFRRDLRNDPKATLKRILKAGIEQLREDGLSAIARALSEWLVRPEDFTEDELLFALAQKGGLILDVQPASRKTEEDKHDQ